MNKFKKYMQEQHPLVRRKVNDNMGLLSKHHLTWGNYLKLDELVTRARATAEPAACLLSRWVRAEARLKSSWREHIQVTLGRRFRLQAALEAAAAPPRMGLDCEGEGPHRLVYLVESGMDCDCVQYSGVVHVLDNPHWRLYEKLVEEINDNAEGPFDLALIPYDKVHEVEYHTRDLAAEAFENGHQHVVYP